MEALQSHGWNKPSLAAAIGDDREAADCVRQILLESHHPQFRAQELLARFEQFAQEHQMIIPKFADALAMSDWPRLGALAEGSQMLAEQSLGNQVPQTMHLARSARQDGAIAASAFGAGFGGSVWAMVPKAQLPEFLPAWEQAYRAAFPAEAPRSHFFVTSLVAGAMRIL
jgi:galactokinase